MKKYGITLFSGMGGSALGMAQAGIDDLYFNDFEPYAIECLKANFPGKIYDSRDIAKVQGSDILKKIGIKPRELYMLQMSPPCQDFSILNNKPGKAFSDRNKLYAEGLRIAGEIQPKVIVIENVPGFFSNAIIFIEALLEIEKLGYFVDGWVLDSAYYGSVQSRPRAWLVAYRKDLKIRPTQPNKISTPQSVKSILPHIKWIYSTQFKGVIHNPSKPMFTITKTPNFEVVYDDGRIEKPTIEELLALSDFPQDFVLPGSSYIKKWNRIGNVVLPGMMKTLASHIQTQI